MTVFARYMVPIVPFACLTAAVFVDRFADAFHDWFNQNHAALRHVATVGLAAVIDSRQKSIGIVALEDLVRQLVQG